MALSYFKKKKVEVVEGTIFFQKGFMLTLSKKLKQESFILLRSGTEAFKAEFQSLKCLICCGFAITPRLQTFRSLTESLICLQGP